MIIGTAPYMSPEQWQSKPDIDGRADIYSLKTRTERKLQPMVPRQQRSIDNFNAIRSED
jgi:serine/threonine protein kinase